MPRLRDETPYKVLVYLADGEDEHIAKEAPPGTLAVSADRQGMDGKMVEWGFVRMVRWERTDSSTVLTLWRKPGLKMPKLGMGKPPEWHDLYGCNNGDECFSCCGIETASLKHLADFGRDGHGEEYDEENDEYIESDDCRLAHLYLSIKRPYNPKHNAPSIRIWEGKCSLKNREGKLVFNRNLRLWLKLPHNCTYELFDTRLI